MKGFGRRNRPTKTKDDVQADKRIIRKIGTEGEYIKLIASI